MASNEADAWLTAAPVAQQAIFAELRKLVKSFGSDVAEEIKWSRPCYSTERGLFCYLQSTKHHATLGFQQGASLSDPENLLDGSGKDMRHIKFKGDMKLNKAAIVALLKQAKSR
ncbi:MAG: DUF1801 domain-containing protein [Bryobacteraceae bacterium]